MARKNRSNDVLLTSDEAPKPKKAAKAKKEAPVEEAKPEIDLASEEPVNGTIN